MNYIQTKLDFCSKSLYENRSQHLDLISGLLRRRTLKNDQDFLGVPEKISNYIELARSLSEGSKKYSFTTIWRIKALAELEAYLFRHGRKLIIRLIYN